MNHIYTVSQLIARLNHYFESEKDLNNLRIKGELSSVTKYRSGHLYFTLKDDDSIIRCVMFASYQDELSFIPKDGLEVVLRGRVQIYPPKGELKILCYAMEPAGRGQLLEQLERLKKKLAAEGLFAQERKRSIPPFPRLVGLVTSWSGAVLHDIFTTLRRRNPAIKLLLVPAQVQGPEAAAQMSHALRVLASIPTVEVIIIARGGGSFEDLMAFNSELLVRTIAECPVPVISGVGHETDTTLCDYAADIRAPTPTAAAEMVARPLNELSSQVSELTRRLSQAVSNRLKQERYQLESIKSHPILKNPHKLIELEWQKLDDYQRRLFQAMTLRVEKERHTLNTLRCSPILSHPERMYIIHRERLRVLYQNLLKNHAQQLAQKRHIWERLTTQIHALSPYRVLERGYAICFDSNGQAVSTIKGRSAGESLEVRLKDGRLHTHIKLVEPN